MRLSVDNKPSPPPPETPRSANNEAPYKRVRSGSVGMMGLALGDLKSRAKAAERIESGSAVVELDTALIDDSFIADRVSDANDPTLAALVESIQESGQQVPILVRPHPEVGGRYQIAYGRRRTRAAQILGKPARAVVRPLSDAELVVAQGKENLDRRDLSYIERAFFALRLEERGFARETICAAMSADRAAVSHYVAVARTIPEHVVAAIGPAPKAGRPRWLALAERIKTVGTSRLSSLFGDATFQAKPTDERFSAVLEALSPKAQPKPRAQIWKDEAGRSVARIEESAERFNLSIDRKIEPEFGSYLLSRLPEILAAFKACQK